MGKRLALLVLFVFGLCAQAQGVIWASGVIYNLRWSPGPHPSHSGSYWGLAIGDLNLDGKADLVATKYMGGLEVFLGDGKGGFVLSQSNLPKQGFYYDVALGDFNSDGWLDVVAAKYEEGLEIWLWESRGYRLAQELFSDGTCYQLRVADIDLDGSLDILATSSSGIKVFMKKGRGFVEVKDGLPGYEHFFAISVCDLDQDGLLDLAAGSDSNSGVKVWFSRKSGGWINRSQGLPTIGNFHMLGICDINRDEKLDLVVGGGSKGGIGVFLGNGAGSWRSLPTNLPNEGSYHGIQTLDLDRDGDLDLVTGSTSDEGVRVFLNEGEGRFSLASCGLPTKGFWHDILLLDLNSDEYYDMIAATSSGIKVYFGGEGGWVFLGWSEKPGYTTDGLSPEYGSPKTEFTFRVTYLNLKNIPPRDGYPSLNVFKGKRLIGRYPLREEDKSDKDYRDGKLYRIRKRFKELGRYTYRFEAKDADGHEAEGTPLFSQPGPVITKEGIGQKRWCELTVPKTSFGHYGHVISDLNLDGVLDVVVATSSGIEAFIDQAGKWVPASSGLPKTGFFYAVRLADFNKDCKLDLVATSKTGIRAWIGDGDGRWIDSSWGLPRTGFYYGLSLGDVNQDGVPDAVCGTNDRCGVQVFLSDGCRRWQEANTGLPDKGHLCSVAIVDLNKDGLLDIVAGDFGGVRFYLNENQSKANCPTHDLPIRLNFDLSGRPDILSGRYDGVVKGYLGNGRGEWRYGSTMLSAIDLGPIE